MFGNQLKVRSVRLCAMQPSLQCTSTEPERRSRTRMERVADSGARRVDGGVTSLATSPAGTASMSMDLT